MATYDAAAVEKLNRLYAAPQIVEQRRRFRAILRAGPGERGLDVGSGAGHLSCELAHEVGPAGMIHSIGYEPGLGRGDRTQARSEGLADILRPRIGDATALPFDDSSLDFVAVVQVLLR